MLQFISLYELCSCYIHCTATFPDISNYNIVANFKMPVVIVIKQSLLMIILAMMKCRCSVLSYELIYDVNLDNEILACLTLPHSTGGTICNYVSVNL